MLQKHYLQDNGAFTHTMIMLCLLFITNAKSQELNNGDHNGASPARNVTTLYPILNKSENFTNNNTIINKDKTTWKVEANFAGSNLDKEIDDTVKINNVTNHKEQAREIHDSKEFKPSQQLGSFVEEELTEAYKVLDHNEEYGFQFVSPYKDNYPRYKPLAEDIKPSTKFPLKYQNIIHHRPKDVWAKEVMEARPTIQMPVHIPAGGLYNLDDPFTGHPSIGHAEEHEVDITEHVNENYNIKRVNPWQRVVQLMAALVPAGLIVSALSPGIITIHNTGPEARASSHVMRRSASASTTLEAISEQCRRRLLCELHAEANYQQSQPLRKGKHCYKIYCEDSQAVSRILHWLLNYHQSSHDVRLQEIKNRKN